MVLFLNDINYLHSIHSPLLHAFNSIEHPIDSDFDTVKIGNPYDNQSGIQETV